MPGLVLVVLLAGVFLGVGGVRPDQARAFFPGESLVIDPATGALTKSAEELIRQGKTIPEIMAEARSFAGGGNVAEETAALGAFEGAGAIPTVGTMVAGFTAGWEIGSQVCGMLGIEGCFSLSGLFGTSSPPAGAGGFPSGGEYVFNTGGLFGGPAFSYYWRFGTSGSPNYSKAVEGLSDTSEPKCAYWTKPGGYDSVTQSGETPTGSYDCEVGGVKYTAKYFTFARYGLHDLQFTGPGADTAAPNVPFTPSSGWAGKEGLPKRLKETPQGERVGQDIAHKLSPGTVASPYATYVTVPACDELTWGACKAALEGKELVPVRESINWDEVTTDVPAEVLTLTPPAGNNVETKSTVTVKTNPDESGMPVIVPEPEEHETYEHYAARLNPALNPHRLTVSDANEDAAAGPNAVLGTSPAPGTATDPATTTEVEVRTNPADAPPVGSGGGGGTCGGSIGAIDWSPLNQPVGSKFPFGIFGFFVGWIGEWESGEGTAPDWSVTFLPKGVFGAEGLVSHIDLEFMAPVVSVVRVVFLFASFVGLLWFLGTAAAKLQGDDS